MGFEDPEFREAFFALHSDLPREAPGGRAETLRALEIAAPPEDARVLDLGCGPGPATEVLLEALPKAHVTALDLHVPFVEEAHRRAEALGAGDRFEGLAADMATPPVPPGSVDLIWSEGAAYSIGVAAALRAWKPLLAPGGRIAFSEAVWLTGAPSERARTFWAAYPDLAPISEVRGRIAAEGYEIIGEFVLPETCWDAYYEPLDARGDALAPGFVTPGAKAALAETRDEFAVWQDCRGEYGYAFFVVAPA